MTGKTQQSDEHLMRRAVSGDEAAFEALFERYQARLVGYCVRMVSNRAEAEEVAAEAFLAIFRRRETYQYPRPFRPWLFAIARNAAIARLKEREKPPVEVEPSALGTVDPAAEASKLEEINRLMQALAGVKAEFRETLELYYFGGLSTPEIAEVLDVPQGTVRSRLCRGIASLKDALPG